MTATPRPKLTIPWGTIFAALGVIGTILGIIGFFVSDLPGLLGTKEEGLTEEDFIATLVALQNDRQQAELQLTQYALDQFQAANQSTQQAVSQQQASLQATLAAVQLEQEAMVATRNAIAAVTATAEAEQAAATATADAINAVATQAALDITATAAFIVQITPTETPQPTATPTPTPTPTPAPVFDHRAPVAVSVVLERNRRLTFTFQVAQPVPAEPPTGLAYVWLIDVDQNPATGMAFQDIGVEMRVAVRVDNGTWIGTVRSVQPDGTLGEPLFFLDVTVQDTLIEAKLDPSGFGLPEIFDWVARAEEGEQAYAFYPGSGHLTVVVR